ncbi:MAG: hypothetical protein ACJAUF_001545 [Bacteroidia bacterium]|jgi:hypothetical protein
MKRSLIIEPSKMFYYWDTTNFEVSYNSEIYENIHISEGFEQKSFEIYREIVYAKGENLFLSKPVFILSPPFLNEQAIKEIDRTFRYFKANYELDTLVRKNLWVLESKLLSGSLNGVQKHIEILKNFKSHFPDYDEGRLNESLKLLDEYERHKLDATERQ